MTDNTNPAKAYEFSVLITMLDGSEQIIVIKRTFDEADRLGLPGEPWPAEFPAKESVSTVEVI